MKALITSALLLATGAAQADCVTLAETFEVCDLEGTTDAGMEDNFYFMEVEDARIHAVGLPVMDGIATEMDVLGQEAYGFTAMRPNTQVFEILDAQKLDCAAPSRVIAYRADGLMAVYTIYTVQDRYVLFMSNGANGDTPLAEHDQLISQFGDRNGLRKDCDIG
ncbi:hypothetical protein HCZ30_11040 [Marivivens donghaensis]|uniref:Uncharacterized protein n=1 Tax=Marivivens donghaensis TaxID=1699413 RepID=A0ABX0VY25_9RHOB|nr:hypothetical protein [Marivivens donghaensis]NIY72965.1 hypothetical protein [Marivivens donghaensis]